MGMGKRERGGRVFFIAYDASMGKGEREKSLDFSHMRQTLFLPRPGYQTGGLR